MTFFKLGINGCAAFVAVLVCLGGCDESSHPEKIATNISDTINLKHPTVIDRNYKALSMAIKQHTAPPEIISRGGDMTDDECCTELGQVSECWKQDAQDDQAIISCSDDADCASGDCASGRCTCTTNNDCDGNGACSESGVCGPSWCNGYLICGCWGGCEWWQTSGDQSITPDVWAASLDKYCFEGNYPEGSDDPDVMVSGYFSSNTNHDGGCFDNIDCDYLDSECKEGVCDVTTGKCNISNIAAGTPCTNEDETTYPSKSYPDSCYNFYCGEHDGTDPAGPTGPTVAANNGLCEPAFDLDGLELNNTCASPTSIGTFTAAADDGAILKLEGSTICATDIYESGGDDCNNLGNNGVELVYSFDYYTNVSDQYQLRGFVVQLEANFDVSVYASTNCPGTGTVASNRCLLPYAGTDPWEEKTNLWGNSLYSTSTPPYQQCCEDSATGTDCYKWCERGDWDYPSAPVPCDDGATGTTTCTTHATDTSHTNMASTVVYPDGQSGDISEKKTVYIFVDSANGEQGDFTLTVEHRNWNAGPVERINDDPRVYDVTNVTGEVAYMGNLAGAVNSQHAATGDCGKFDCSDTAWAGKSKKGCHDSTKPATKLWPNKEYFKIHRQDGNQPYCITTDESVNGSADLVLDVLTRKNNGSGKTISPIFVDGATINYNEDIYCEHDTQDGNAMIEIPGVEDVLYLIGVSQRSPSTSTSGLCDPAVENCNYKLIVTPGECARNPMYECDLERNVPSNGTPILYDYPGLVEGCKIPLSGTIKVGGVFPKLQVASGTITDDGNNCFERKITSKKVAGLSVGPNTNDQVWLLENIGNPKNVRIFIKNNTGGDHDIGMLIAGCTKYTVTPYLGTKKPMGSFKGYYSGFIRTHSDWPVFLVIEKPITSIGIPIDYTISVTWR